VMFISGEGADLMVERNNAASVRVPGSRLHGNHPTHTEAVFYHAEAGRPEGFRRRHPHLAAVRQSRKDAIHFGFSRHREREGKAFEGGLFRRAAVRGHERGVADTEARMHDFILETGRDHVGLRRFGTVLETHHHLHLGPEGLPIEFDGFFATAVEEKIRLNEAVAFCRVHDSQSVFLFSSVQRTCRRIQDIFFNSDSSRSRFCSFAGTQIGFHCPQSAADLKVWRKVILVRSSCSSRMTSTRNCGPEMCSRTIRSGFARFRKTVWFLYSLPSGPRMT